MSKNLMKIYPLYYTGITTYYTLSTPTMILTFLYDHLHSIEEAKMCNITVQSNVRSFFPWRASVPVSSVSTSSDSTYFPSLLTPSTQWALWTTLPPLPMPHHTCLVIFRIVIGTLLQGST